eukprot:103880-Lingulodinium_polyedra.AAC.1
MGVCMDSAPLSTRYACACIRKPRRIASYNSSLPSMFNKKCDARHLHHPREGPDTLASQGYVPLI